MLNYSQPSSFYRAFKNWFGVTPKAFRKRIAGAQADNTLQTKDSTGNKQPSRVRS